MLHRPRKSVPGTGADGFAYSPTAAGMRHVLFRRPSVDQLLRWVVHRLLTTDFELRVAEWSDLQDLGALIARSLRGLSAGYYTPEQVEGALLGACAVDSQLVRDGTYFVATLGDRIVGCGGWSHRQTLFGGDSRPGRDPAGLDPRVDAAKIRAFFVEPAYVRRGIGRRILERCESEARARGFTRFELMATLPGVPLYAACGYAAAEPVEYRLPDGQPIRFVPMSRADSRM